MIDHNRQNIEHHNLLDNTFAIQWLPYDRIKLFSDIIINNFNTYQPPSLLILCKNYVRNNLQKLKFTSRKHLNEYASLKLGIDLTH